jgi:hypothetical protein
MWKKFGAALTAVAVMGATLAPMGAYADDDGWRGRRHDDGYGRHYDRRYDRHYGYDDRRHYRHRDHDDDDAIVAGVVGLALGAVLGAAISQNQDRRAYEERYAPPPRQDYRSYQREQRTCYRRERQWDPYANRYLWVDVPYGC